MMKSCHTKKSKGFLKCQLLSSAEKFFGFLFCRDPKKFSCVFIKEKAELILKVSINFKILAKYAKSAVFFFFFFSGKKKYHMQDGILIDFLIFFFLLHIFSNASHLRKKLNYNVHLSQTLNKQSIMND